MTGIQPTPSNLSIEIKTPEELAKAQEELEVAKKKVEELLAKFQGYSDQLANLNINLSVGGRIKQDIIKGIVDPLLNFNCLDFELPALQLSLLVSLLSVPIPTIPPIPDPLKLLLGLKVNVALELPTVAEFRQYINAKIEEAKQKCQEQTIKKQLADAAQEELPFTARLNAITLANTAATRDAGPPCITTERGKTVDEAISKAHFKLSRIQKCCECCGTKELKIINSKEENGVFIVTVGILDK